MRKLKFRTDLAIESADTGDKKLPKGVFVEETAIGNITKTVVEIKTQNASLRLNRPVGRYVTLEGDFLFKDELTFLLEEEVKKMLPEGKILAVGLGNLNITPDSVGPLSAEKIMATSHLSKDFKDKFGLSDMREVAVLFPGSAGQTGIETARQIKTIAKSEGAECIVAIDALAAISSKRLGKTIQLTDSGISPGSGVGNKRAEISLETMGMPVISVGVPTVADAFTIAGEKAMHDSMLLTPKDIDLIVKRSSEVIGEALNLSFHEKIGRESLKLLM